jgi:type I restriction enzyme, S subunit
MSELKTSKYQAYPEYKDSGVEWLDEIPKHWVLSRVKYIAPFQVGWTPPTKNDENFVGNNLWANISDLKEKIITNTSKQISDKAAKEASMSITPKGSLMYSFKLSVGAVSFAGDNMYTNEAIASFLDSARLPLSYLYYALPKFVIENASTNIYGARILNQELISNAQVLEPTFEEAENIAKFLDHETAKIDTLIDKQQQLIKLLKEKRQAVISHAVTKGISNKKHPQAPMKDSGVEWLGEVPAHWSICTLKRHANFIDGDRSSEYPNENDLKESGVLFLSSKNISNGKLSIKNTNFISSQKFERLNRGKAIDGDLIVKVRGSTGRIGELAIFEADRIKHITAFINAQMMIIRVKASLNNYFLSNIAQAHCWMEQLNLGAYGTAQQQLNNTVFANVIMVVPPLCEQKEINAHLGLVTNHFDSLINKATSAIKLMQERHTALISAAVTGKIDVRNWIEPTEIHEEK